MNENELRTALAELHEASYGWTLHCCFQQVEQAEEVLQNVYVKVLSGKAGFKGRSTFKTWLFGVIRRTAAEERRRRARFHLRYSPDVGVEEAESEAPRIGKALESSERAAALSELITDLPERQQEVLHLVFYQDCTLEEAAVVMKVSIGSVRSYYARAKDRLRARWPMEERLHEAE